MTIFDNYAARYERTREEEYSLSEYLALCKKDRLTYASAPERMLAAIGEPTLVDTRNDTRYLLRTQTKRERARKGSNVGSKLA